MAQQISSLTAAVRELQQQSLPKPLVVETTAPLPVAPSRLSPRRKEASRQGLRRPRSSSPRPVSPTQPSPRPGRSSAHREPHHARRRSSPPARDRRSPRGSCSRIPTSRRSRSPGRRNIHYRHAARPSERATGRYPSPASRSSQEDSSDHAIRHLAARRIEHYERQLNEANRRLAEAERNGHHPADGFVESIPPLSREIIEEPIPSRFRMPQVDPYDGTSDPLDHLEGYKALMMIQGANDALLCKAFPATLRKAARVWYSNLEPRSINSFPQLERQFAAYFNACRKLPREPESLFSVRQQEGESLKDYVARFKLATMEVYSLDESVAMLAMKRGLRSSRFTYSLDKTYPKSYAELLTRAQKYIRAEEAMNIRRETDGKPNKKKAKAEPNNTKPERGEPSRRSEASSSRRQANKFPDYAPLIAPRTNILMEIEGEAYLRRPPPLKRPPEARDRSKYCRFHRDHGHDTEECFALKNEIEELIRRGFLRKYVRRGEVQPKPQEAGEVH